MKKDFETLKQEILKKAKEKKVCRMGYGRFLDVDNIYEAQEIILNNLDFVIFRSIITPENAKYFKKLKVIDNIIFFKERKYIIDKDDIIYEKYSNGQLSVKSNYHNGKQHGLYEDWYKNGQQSEKSYFEDGKLNGLSNIWYSNGQLATRTYFKDGKKHGVNEMWDFYGKQIIKEYYIDNEKVTQEEWEEYNGKSI